MSSCSLKELPILIMLTTFAALAESNVPAIIVFGDSTVDSGNNNAMLTILKSNFHPYGKDFQGGQATGRFSNGRIATDFISEGLGLKPFVPPYLNPDYTIDDFATGVSFASAGTGYDNVTSQILNVIPLWKELELFVDYQKKLRELLGEEKGDEIIREALYVISLGTNDFMENYFAITTRRLQFTVEEFQNFIVQIAGDFLANLYGAGARKVALSGLPPMGCLPLERTTNIFTPRDCIEEYNDVALQFNEKLELKVSQLKKNLLDLKIVFFKTIYDTLLAAITDPNSYGFEEASLACCATGMFEMSYLCNKGSYTCPDADKYVFWDAFHPTEKTNKMLVDQIMPLLLAEFR